MSDFILIVPDGWTELLAISDLINFGSEPAEAVAFQISQQSWGDIENLLINAAALPEGKHVVNARLISTETGYRFWVVLV